MKTMNVDSREISISWKEPDINGAKIERYDVVAGPSHRMVRWAHLAQLLLGSTIDLDKLFGYELTGGVQVGDKRGLEGCDQLRCKEILWAPLKGDVTQFDIPRLLPGQDYYFAVRGVNCKGKGELSEIFGPVTTLAEKPEPITPAEITEVKETSAKFIYKLPYNFGAPFVEAAAVLERWAGPLSDDEIHPETKEPHEHIAKRQWALDLSERAIEPERTGKGNWIRGTTEAIMRSYRAEGADGQFGQWHDHIPTLANPTNFAREGSIEGLIPGTYYRFTWHARTKGGWTAFAEPTEFLTESTVPDAPAPLVVFTA